MRLKKQLATVIREVRRGDLDRARRLLVAHLKEQVDDIEAWYLLSYLVPTRYEQIRALGYLLRHAPNHERALMRLQELQNAPISALDRPESFERALSTVPQPENNMQPTDRSEAPTHSPLSEGLLQTLHDLCDGEGMGQSTVNGEERLYSVDWILSAAEDMRGSRESEPFDIVEIFFEDVKQLPIISNRSQQFWLGAHMQAPARLDELEPSGTSSLLLERLLACWVQLEELCAGGDVRLPRLRSWVAEASRARADIHRLKRSRVRRFLRDLDDKSSDDLITKIEDTVYELVELLCLLPDATLRRLAHELPQTGTLPTVEGLTEWLEAGVKNRSSTGVREPAKRRRDWAKTTLAIGYLRYGLRIASNYIGQGLPYLDLVQAAFSGLVRGAEKFNYRDHGRFGHYGTTWVWQRVTRAIAVKARTVRLPVHIHQKLERLDNLELERRTGRRPLSRDLPILSALDFLTKEEANQIEDAGADAPLPAPLEKRYRRAQRKVEKFQIWKEAPRSLSEPASPLSDERHLKSNWIEWQADRLVDKTSVKFEREIEIAELRTQLLDLLERSVSWKRDYRMLRLRFGFEDGEYHTLEEVGATFGLTRERVRQIEAKALEELRDKFARDDSLENPLEASWIECWLANVSQPEELSVTVREKRADSNVQAEKARLGRLIDELPRGSWGRWQRGATREEQLKVALQSLGGVAHYADICESLGDESDITSAAAYSVLLSGEEIFVPLGEGYFSLVEWEAERTKESHPILPYCPQPFPDPPDYEDAFFEAVLVAHKKLRGETLSAEQLVDEMLAWVQAKEEVPRWRKQSYLSALYAVGLIPYIFYFGGQNPPLETRLPDLPIRELRSYCLSTFTERVRAMPQFWWVLSSYAPARPSDLGEEFIDAHPEEIDDTLYRLYLLAGLGAVRRLAYGRYELTPLGMEMAQQLGSRPKRMESQDQRADDLDSSFTAMIFDW